MENSKLNTGHNLSWNNYTWNFSEKVEFDPKLLIEQYMLNRKVDDPAFHILIFMYSVLILVGAVGNTLVVSVDLSV